MIAMCKNCSNPNFDSVLEDSEIKLLFIDVILNQASYLIKHYTSRLRKHVRCLTNQTEIQKRSGVPTAVYLYFMR